MAKPKISFKEWLDGDVSGWTPDKEEERFFRALFSRVVACYIIFDQGLVICFKMEEIKRELAPYLEKILGGPLTANDLSELENIIKEYADNVQIGVLLAKESGGPASIN